MWDQTSEDRPRAYECNTDDGVLYVEFYRHHSDLGCAILEVGIRDMPQYMLTRDTHEGQWGDLQIMAEHTELLKKHLPKLKALPNDEMKDLMDISQLEAQVHTK